MSVLSGCEKQSGAPELKELTCPMCCAEVEVITRRGLMVEDAICPGCGHIVKKQHAES